MTYVSRRGGGTGPRGPAGPAGPAGGTFTFSSDVTDGDLLAYDLPNTQLVRAPARMLPNNELAFTAADVQAEAGTQRMTPGTGFTFSSSFPIALIDQFPTLQFGFPDVAHRRDGPSFELRWLHFTEEENDLPLTTDDSETITTNPLSFQLPATTDSRINSLRFISTGAMSNVRVRATYATGAMGDIYYFPSFEAWDRGTGGADYPTPGEQTIDFGDSQPRLFATQPGGVNVVQFEIRADGPLAIRGSSTDMPALTARLQRGEFRVVASLDDPATVERMQDLVAAMFTDGDHSGLTINYDDDNNTIDLAVTGVTPPPSTDPAVNNFSIDVPSVVATGTTLNGAQNITFTTQGTSDITALNLVVTGGDDVALTVPSMDGTHTVSVTLAGIDTSSAGTVSFQIRGTTSGGQTIMSNTSTTTIRAVTVDEQAYYAFRATNDFVTVDTNLLTPVDVQQPGSSYTISGSFPAGEILGILEPEDRRITSIVESAFGREILGRFTRSGNVRTIGGQSFALLTLTNMGPTGNISYEVTHG